MYVSTALADCEKTDRNGLYAKARRGEIQNFTGVTDPYEPPENPEIMINASNISIARTPTIMNLFLYLDARQAVHEIILYLEQEGYFASTA